MAAGRTCELGLTGPAILRQSIPKRRPPGAQIAGDTMRAAVLLPILFAGCAQDYDISAEKEGQAGTDDTSTPMDPVGDDEDEDTGDFCD